MQSDYRSERIDIPTKKPRKSKKNPTPPLSDEQKAANTALSQVCIFIVSNWEVHIPHPFSESRLRQAPQTGWVLAGESDQGGGALHQLGDRPGRHSPTTLDPRLRERGQPGVVGIARRAKAGEDIQAKLVRGLG